MKGGRFLLAVSGLCMVFLVGSISSALGMDMQGFVSKPKLLVTGMAITTKVKTVMKIKFAGYQLYAGQTLALCAGDAKDFQAGDCPVVLSVVSGPDDEGPYITIIDVSQVSGKNIYILCEGPHCQDPAGFSGPSYNMSFE